MYRVIVNNRMCKKCIKDIVNNNIYNIMDCERCGQSFNTKKCLIQHLRKRIECMCIFSEKVRSVILEELLNKEGIECDICNKKYVNVYTLGRHNKICNKGLSGLINLNMD
jgi:hypothetical protein